MRLLKKNHVQGPYIIVSHSYGSLYAGHLARKHPDLIAGLLMIDPVPSNYQYSDEILKKFNITLASLKDSSSKEAYQLDNLKMARRNNIMAADSFYQQLGFNKTKKQVAELPTTKNNFPIIIVSSTYMVKNAPIKGNWYALQKQWLNQNPESIIFKVRGGHFLHLDQPKLICKELNKLIKLAIHSSNK